MANTAKLALGTVKKVDLSHDQKMIVMKKAHALLASKRES